MVLPSCNPIACFHALLRPWQVYLQITRCYACLYVTCCDCHRYAHCTDFQFDRRDALPCGFHLIGVTPFHAFRRVPPNNIQPSNIPSSIAKEGSQYLHEIAQKANKLSKAQAFLKSAEPFISRINSHRHYSSQF